MTFLHIHNLWLPFLVLFGASSAPFFATATFDISMLPTNRDNPNQPDGVGACMANGIFNLEDPNYTPPDYTFFEEQIMGRVTQQAKDERFSEIADYFLERFGVDFVNFIAENGLIFSADRKAILNFGYVDPRWNYRCYKLPGRQVVPPSGLINHDGTVAMVAIVDMDFFGTWGGPDGTPVPAGTAAVDGEYLIQGTNTYTLNHPRNTLFRFQSVSPLFPSADGTIKFDCLLFSDEFGAGAAIGRQEFYGLGNGLTQVAVQNVLQFPTPEWAEP